MSTELPLMSDELMIEFKVSPQHPYFKEIRSLLSIAFVIEMTGKALIEVPKRSRFIDGAALRALDDYIEVLTILSSNIHQIKEENKVYDRD